MANEVVIAIVSKEDAFLLDNCMFVVEGNWETGYVYDKDVFSIILPGVDRFFLLGNTCNFNPWYFNLKAREQEMLRKEPELRAFLDKALNGRKITI